MARNLVIVRAGSRSLHEGWLGADPAARNWDLYVSPYEHMAASAADCTVGEVIPGAKWTGLNTLLSQWDGWRGYDYVWLPDDDIATDSATITRIFEVAADVGLQLFSPALDKRSYYDHFTMMQNERCFGRWCGFVEIMVPGLSVEALSTVLPTLAETATGWGWGLDSVWPKLLAYRNVGVIDAVTVTHTRPVGSMRDASLVKRLLDEVHQLHTTYDCRPVHTTFGLFDENGGERELSSEELLVELVRGWDYLLERDPRVLSWTVGFQREHFGDGDYPEVGTPEMSGPGATTP